MSGLVPLLDQKQPAARGVGAQCAGAAAAPTEARGSRTVGCTSTEHKAPEHHTVTVQRRVGAHLVLLGGVGAELRGGFRKLRATEWFVFLGWRSSACDQAADLCAGAKFSCVQRGLAKFPFRYSAHARVQSSTAVLAARAVRPEIAHRNRIQPASQR